MTESAKQKSRTTLILLLSILPQPHVSWLRYFIFKIGLTLITFLITLKCFYSTSSIQGSAFLFHVVDSSNNLQPESRGVPGMPYVCRKWRQKRP